ncbi:uncharacterized protein LOC101853980 [Aplysia californica]|uniref:Uncharacterized protein LOC101853980 n=1 Tax=Aplysia californica TaxID=6500 RepID=A0ABM0K7M0_APLCA|nr:uncharacterized protein LOC101853980 [Aplysia californica]
MSHYILRLILGGDKMTSSFFIQAEKTLFFSRLDRMVEREWRNLFKTLEKSFMHLSAAQECTTASQHHEMENLQYICLALKSQFLRWTNVASEICQCETQEKISLPFHCVFGLVASRQVELDKGMALVPVHCLKQVFAEQFEVLLRMTVKQASKSRERAMQDERLLHLANILTREYRAQTCHSKRRWAADVGRLQLPDLWRCSARFPPCMVSLVDTLRRQHRLRHHDRVQLTLFLKELGLSVHNALLLWKREFSTPTGSDGAPRCHHSWHGNERRYIYNIRHLYGLEGRRVDYCGHSCPTIQARSGGCVGSGGCPFVTLREQPAENWHFLRDLPTEAATEIRVLSRLGHYGKACKYFSHHLVKQSFSPMFKDFDHESHSQCCVGCGAEILHLEMSNTEKVEIVTKKCFASSDPSHSLGTHHRRSDSMRDTEHESASGAPQRAEERLSASRHSRKPCSYITRGKVDATVGVDSVVPTASLVKSPVGSKPHRCGLNNGPPNVRPFEDLSTNSVCRSHVMIQSHITTQSHGKTQSHDTTQSHLTTPSHDTTQSHLTTQSHDTTQSHLTTPSHDTIQSHLTTPSHDTTQSHDKTSDTTENNNGHGSRENSATNSSATQERTSQCCRNVTNSDLGNAAHRTFIDCDFRRRKASGTPTRQGELAVLNTSCSKKGESNVLNTCHNKTCCCVSSCSSCFPQDASSYFQKRKLVCSTNANGAGKFSCKCSAEKCSLLKRKLFTADVSKADYLCGNSGRVEAELDSPVRDCDSFIEGSEQRRPISEQHKPISEQHRPISEQHRPISEQHRPISEQHRPISVCRNSSCPDVSAECQSWRGKKRKLFCSDCECSSVGMSSPLSGDLRRSHNVLKQIDHPKEFYYSLTKHMHKI